MGIDACFYTLLLACRSFSWLLSPVAPLTNISRIARLKGGGVITLDIQYQLTRQELDSGWKG